MKKFYLLALSIITLSAAFAQKEWNISNDVLFPAGSIAATVEIDGLTIYSDDNVTIDANGKSIDGYTFTQRLKLGGGGKIDSATSVIQSRVLSFAIEQNTTVTIYCVSSSSSSDRKLYLATSEDPKTPIDSIDALGSIGKGSYNYTGEATNFLIYSPASGVNIYLIKTEAYIPSSVSTINSNKEVIETIYYNINGTIAGTDELDLVNGIYVKKSTYSDGSSDSEKVSINK